MRCASVITPAHWRAWRGCCFELDLNCESHSWELEMWPQNMSYHLHTDHTPVVDTKYIYKTPEVHECCALLFLIIFKWISCCWKLKLTLHFRVPGKAWFPNSELTQWCMTWKYQTCHRTNRWAYAGSRSEPMLILIIQPDGHNLSNSLLPSYAEARLLWDIMLVSVKHVNRVAQKPFECINRVDERNLLLTYTQHLILIGWVLSWCLQ